MKNLVSTFQLLSVFFLDFFKWFVASKYLNENSFTTRLRTYQKTAFLIFFINSFLNFIAQLTYSYLITSAGSLLFIFIGYLIERNRIQLSYILMLVSVNLALILLVYVEGLRSAVYLFFFPSIISFAFLVDLTKKKNMQVTYAICIGSFLIAVSLAGEYGVNGQTMSENAYQQNLYFNLLSSFLLIGWMSFSLAKENSRKQKNLKDKEVFLDTIFNSSLHAEVIVDMETGLISNCNLQSGVLFAAGNASLLNMPACKLFLEVAHGENEELYREMCNPAINWEGELTCLCLDGGEFPGSISIVTFQYHDKNYKKLTIIDITEKNYILNELQAAKIKAEESVAVKSQFLSNMSHELRTPLNGIIGATNLLLQDTYLPSQQEQLNILKFSSEHTLSLINDILDLSKLEANKIKLEQIVVDIPAFIESLTSTFNQQYKDKGLQFEVEIDSAINRTVLGDPTRLNQVLTNLLSNALKFTVEGSVKLSVKARSIKSDTCKIEFSVADTGIGISLDKQKIIFDQFSQADAKTTRKYGGTGLGLTISQKFVSLMGGELKVDSRYNKGSRFYFELNFDVKSTQDKVYINEKVFSVNEKLTGVKVLLAEDNPVNMMIASKFLEKWGLIVRKAGNGSEAISLYQQDEFDLILMDLEMPEVDGYEALNAIRFINPDVPAIAFTAAVFENMRDKLNACGFNDYIQKPFRPEDLHSKIIKYLRIPEKSI